MALVSFSLTHVRYEENDLLGKILALFTLTPVFIMVMYATILMIRRDIQTGIIVTGQLLNVGINLILKKIFDDPRPQQSELEDEGMPSNHSQFIAFFCTIYIMHFLFQNKTLHIFFRILYSIYVCLLGVIVCYSRYYLQYHHLDQIYVGVIVGIVVGLIWSMFYSYVNLSFSKTLASHWLCKWLQIRDYSDVHYGPSYEFEAIANYHTAGKNKTK